MIYRLRSLRGWQQVLVIVVVSMPVTAMLLGAWIGLVVLLNQNPKNDVSADAALNLLLVLVVALFGLPIMQRGQYRLFWNSRRPAQLPDDPRASAVQTLPPPAVRWSRGLRIRHVLMHLVGMTILIGTFAPFRHQHMIAHFLGRFSAGTASRGSLGRLVFDYGSLLAFCLLACLLTYRQMNRRDAGLLDPDQSLELEAEVNWLFSFAAAFCIAAFLCRWAGSMIIAFL